MATSDGFSPVEAEQIVDGAIGLLARMSVLGNTVTRNGFGNFRGYKDDTVTLRVPAYAVAGNRTLRSATNRTRSKLFQRSVAVKLDQDAHLDVPLTDEEISLDIENLARDIIAPAIGGVARRIETALANLMTTTSYATDTVSIGSDPYDAVVDARKELSDMQVPLGNLTLACGSSVEAEILKSDHIARVDQSGSDSALRRASIGRLANATVISAQALPPDEAYLYHRTAFLLPTRAPEVPQGAPWGDSRSVDGYAMRVMQALDPSDLDGPTNVVFHDSWYGTKATTDVGAIDADGKFEPAEDPDESGADELVVRAVKLELSS